jgi:acyl dehydratase
MTVAAFEDFQPGETRSYGDYEFTAPEMIAFAQVYDAQPFHLDDEAAKNMIFGGLSASGWHTCSALMRMTVDGWLRQTTCLAGIGVEENRWLAPVRPGDRLSAQTVTLEKVDLRSRPEAGIVKFATSLRNQTGQEVLAQKNSILFGRRERLAEQAPLAKSSKPAQNKPAELARIDDPLAALPDDYARARVGAYADLGATHFSADFIKSYAEKFDPLPFHTDEEAGKAHLLGAMSAAGWQTASCWMRQFIALRHKAAGVGETPSLASPGFSDLVWRKPVLVGDTIAFSTQIVAKRATSKPGVGLVQSRNLGFNQRDEVAIEFVSTVFSPIA